MAVERAHARHKLTSLSFFRGTAEEDIGSCGGLSEDEDGEGGVGRNVI